MVVRVFTPLCWLPLHISNKAEKKLHTRAKTSQELGNCPMGQREALLKKAYLNKGFIKKTLIVKIVKL